jgi:MinD-like ATPase involved in chromosome partitioning or flagellar assembly
VGGSVVTFYSYKGGVGRTLALANVASLLARWGHRILCVDWDLEAPGLHLYFKDWCSVRDSPGLVELIGQHAAPSWRDCIRAVALPEIDGRLDLLAAGRLDEGYVRRMQSLDWGDLYRSEDLGSRIESFRQEWKNEYDFVLIDSRTGVTDIGGICTIQLPDVLVLLFTANHQGIDGIVDVAQRATQERNHLPFDRAGMPCIPVASRFDGRVEGELSRQWLDTFAERFDALYRAWMHRQVSARELLDFLRIPYIPRFSYGEPLPVITEGTRDPESIGYALETVAALLALQLGETDLLVRQRDSFVSLARGGPVHERSFVYDAFLGFSERESSVARLVTEALAARGAKVAGDHASSGVAWAPHYLNRIMRQSQHFFFLVGKDVSVTQQDEIEIALRELTKERHFSRRIVPILVGDTTVQDLPAPLRSFMALRLADPHAPGEIDAIVQAFETEGMRGGREV